tara:strand:- start:344 stop:850 length:507 start_codon:yes stop_codon:yes gene_type:complete
MSCKGCNDSKSIVNKHFGLCQECNNIRLHGSKYGKTYTISNKDIKPLRTRKNKAKKSLFSNVKATPKKNIKRLAEDEAFYEECFNLSNHKCEECGVQLPTEFRDDEGNVNARWRYSHIVAKSIAPELRLDVSNINHLCLSHHTQWDHADKENMKIYKKNKEKLPKYFS